MVHGGRLDVLPVRLSGCCAPTFAVFDYNEERSINDHAHHRRRDEGVLKTNRQPGSDTITLHVSPFFHVVGKVITHNCKRQRIPNEHDRDQHLSRQIFITINSIVYSQGSSDGG